VHFISASRRSDFEGEFGAFVSALQATPRFDDNPCACRRCTLDRPISGGPIDNDDLCDALRQHGGNNRADRVLLAQGRG
jgi:hypothetical protein